MMSFHSTEHRVSQLRTLTWPATSRGRSSATRFVTAFTNLSGIFPNVGRCSKLAEIVFTHSSVSWGTMNGRWGLVSLSAAPLLPGISSASPPAGPGWVEGRRERDLRREKGLL